MVREPHHDKNLIIKSKIKIHKSKIFLGFSNVPFIAVVFGGLSVNCAEASTNGAKHKFGSHAELVCELRQIVSPAVLRDSFVVGFLPTFFP